MEPYELELLPLDPPDDDPRWGRRLKAMSDTSADVPSAALRGVFSRLGRWILRTYPARATTP